MELWLFKYSRNGIITHMKQIHKIVEIQYNVSYPKWNEKETIPLKAITKEINKARSSAGLSFLWGNFTIPDPSKFLGQEF